MHQCTPLRIHNTQALARLNHVNHHWPLFNCSSNLNQHTKPLKVSDLTTFCFLLFRCSRYVDKRSLRPGCVSTLRSYLVFLISQFPYGTASPMTYNSVPLMRVHGPVVVRERFLTTLGLFINPYTHLNWTFNENISRGNIKIIWGGNVAEQAENGHEVTCHGKVYSASSGLF